MDLAQLTHDVDLLDVVTEPAAPLPQLLAVRDLPPVVDPTDEPMIALETTSIRCLGAYARTGHPATTEATFVRAEVAERLVRVADGLPPRFSLAVFDAWRSASLQEALLREATANGRAEYVSLPSDDPHHPPPHLTGGAVDLTLTFDGTPLGLGTGFDEFTPLAHTPAFEDRPGRVRDLRRVLYWAMHDHGFVVHDLEWWHFEFGTARWAVIRAASPRYGAATPPRHTPDHTPST